MPATSGAPALTSTSAARPSGPQVCFASRDGWTGDGGTMATNVGVSADVVDADDTVDEPVPGARVIRRTRGLPGGRVVVGSLLIAASAVGVFAAYLGATAAPTTRYLVATVDVTPGTRLADADVLDAGFDAVAMDLPADVADRAIAVEDAAGLVGQRIVAPLAAGELLTRTAVVADGGVADAHTVSFPVPRAAALDGALRVGERIDVLATYATGEGFTSYVVRGVVLVAVGGESAGGVGSSGRGELVLTVAVSEPRQVQALVHAAQLAEVVVSRPTGAVGRDPGAYAPSADAPGPEPDPAATPGSGD